MFKDLQGGNHFEIVILNSTKFQVEILPGGVSNLETFIAQDLREGIVHSQVQDTLVFRYVMFQECKRMLVAFLWKAVLVHFRRGRQLR